MWTDLGEELPDEVLARRVARGDAGAFAALATRHWTAVHRIASSLSRTAAEATEIVEETFLVALHQIEAFPADVRFRVSLYRVAVGLSLEAPDGVPDMAGQRSGIEASIRDALQRLEATVRAAYVLRDVAQLPLEEMAAILRISPAGVREATHRARLVLMNRLGLCSATCARLDLALQAASAEAGQQRSQPKPSPTPAA